MKTVMAIISLTGGDERTIGLVAGIFSLAILVFLIIIIGKLISKDFS